MFSNHFNKSTISVTAINSINSKIKMYQFQKNGLFADWLLNALIMFGYKLRYDLSESNELTYETIAK